MIFCHAMKLFTIDYLKRNISDGYACVFKLYVYYK